MSIKSVLKRFFGDYPFYEQETKDTALSVAQREASYYTRNLPDMVHGTVSVSDGKVIVTEPENDGSYATILVPDKPIVQVFVNGEQVQGEVVVSKSHEVGIKFSPIEPSVTYEVIVSDDELSVSVKANVVIGVEFHLKDCMPRRHLKLVIEGKESYPRPVSPQVILDLLSKHGYNGAIDYIAVNRLCNAGSQQEIVLRGTTPQPGRPARLRPSASVCIDRDPVFRTVRCPKVVIGTTCAVMEPAIEGIPGKNIYGVAIPPLKSENKPPTFGA